MTFDKFVETYDGKAIDYDGGCGVMCVDLAKLYMDKVLELTSKNIGNAEAYWNRYDELSLLPYQYREVSFQVRGEDGACPSFC